MYAALKERLEEFLAYVALVSEYFSEQSSSEVLVFQRFTVVCVSRRKNPLYYLATVVDYDVHLEAVPPSHHRPVAVCPLYVA